MSLGERLQGRLERLGLSPEQAAQAAGMAPDRMLALLDDAADVPRGRLLVRLADALETTVAYLVGLDPDAPVPEEYLVEDQGDLGLLAVDEHALLSAYRRLDVASRAAVLRVIVKMSPEPEVLERRPLQRGAARRPQA